MPSMDLFAADLTASNTSLPISFDLEWPSLDALPTADRRPFIASSYGVDAYDTSAWLAQAGSLFGAGYPTDAAPSSPIAPYGVYLFADNDGFVPGATDEASQAAWLGRLVEELETTFIGNGGRGSGGVLTSLRDEWDRSTAHADFSWCARPRWFRGTSSASEAHLLGTRGPFGAPF